MTTTTHLGLTLVETAQAQKEVTVNTALCRIDAVLNTGAKDKDLATPPGSPATGDVYIVAASPTGAWAGKAGQIAYYDQSWRFIVPLEGMRLWVNDEDKTYIYDGSAWGVPTLAVANGGTGATSASAARTALGLGTAAVADTGTSSGNVPVLNGSGKVADSLLDFPSFQAHKNGTDQTGISSASYTKITFTTEEWDIGSHYDAANSKFLPGKAGKYMITASIYWSGGVVDGAYYDLVIYKNGSPYKACPSTAASASFSPAQSVTALVTLNGSTDYIEIFAYGGGAGSKTVLGSSVYSYFCGHFVGV